MYSVENLEIIKNKWDLKKSGLSIIVLGMFKCTTYKKSKKIKHIWKKYKCEEYDMHSSDLLNKHNWFCN